MTVISSNQGAVKQSEIAADAAFPQIGTALNEDLFTIIGQLHDLALEAHNKHHLFSEGRLRWANQSLDFYTDNRANKLILRLLQNNSPTLRTIDLVINGSTTGNTATTFHDITLNNGDLLYLEIHNSQLSTSPITVENAVNGGSLVSGKTLKKVNLTSSTGMPRLNIDLSGDGEYLCIPVAFRYDWLNNSVAMSDLMWTTGTRWKNDTTVELGSSTAISTGGAILNFLETSLKAWDGEIDTSGWITYNDSTQYPVDGIGGSVNAGFTFGITNSLSEILAGDGSFVLNKSVTANIQGHGVAVDVKVYKGYRRKRLTQRFLYEFISGYLPNQIAVFVIADPAGTPKLITPYQNVLNGQKGELVCTFDPIETVSDYRICFHVIGTNTAPFRLIIDEVKLNPIYYVTSDAIASPAVAGFIQPYAGDGDLDGWMICDGRELTRTGYPELFTSIGTRHGSRNSSVFNIPDYRGMFLRGTAIPNAQSLPFNNITSINVAADTITIAAHPFNHSGIKVRFTTAGTLPAPLAINTDYWIIYVDANTFQVASTLANALAGVPINITAVGTSTSAISQWVDPDAASRVSAQTGASSTGTGSFEDDAFEAHTHGLHRSLISNSSTGIVLDGPGNDFQTGSTGGTETRPLNIATNFLIKLYNDRKNTILSNSRVEYVANTDATNTTSNLINSNASIAGQLIPNNDNLTNPINLVRRVQFSRPIAISDKVYVQVDIGSGGTIWTEASQVFPYHADKNADTDPSFKEYGLSILPVPGQPDSLDLYFRQNGAQKNKTWADFSTWRYRVVMTSNPNAVEVYQDSAAGIVQVYAGDNSPSGWLVCDGTAVSRSAFGGLFNVIGTRFGTGDGSSTFNIPDLRGLFIRGAVIPSIGGAAIGGVISAVNTTTDTITINNHGFNRTGFPILTSGSLPTGISAGNVYYVIYVDANNFRLATSYANALANLKIDLTSATIGGTLTQYIDPDYGSRNALTTGGSTGIGSYEDDQFKSHTHSATIGGGAPGGGFNGPGVNFSYSFTTNATGGTETRPKNVMMNYIIKY